jgi:hypothetical protein
MRAKEHELSTRKRDAFIGVMNNVFTMHQADLIKASAAIGNRFGVGANAIFNPENIKMAYILLQIVWQPIKFLAIKILK